MKGWQVALLCIAIAALSVFGTLLFIRQAEEAPQTDTPRYTADQVIAVAKAFAGEECGYNWWSPPPPGSSEKARWTTVYLGDGKWKVTKDCSSVTTWTFYEATGELKAG